MKILLEYDPATLMGTDANGISVCLAAGMKGFDIEEKKAEVASNANTVINLMSGGATADDLVKLKDKGII